MIVEPKSLTKSAQGGNARNKMLKARRMKQSIKSINDTIKSQRSRNNSVKKTSFQRNAEIMDRRACMVNAYHKMQDYLEDIDPTIKTMSEIADDEMNQIADRYENSLYGHSYGFWEDDDFVWEFRSALNEFKDYVKEQISRIEAGDYD